MISERFQKDATLVRQSRAGDRAAFTELVRKYENAAYATALNYVREVEDAKDIVQEAFIAAYCKLAQLREPERFGGWLRTIVQTRSMEWMRRQGTIPIADCAIEAAHEHLMHSSSNQYLTEQRNTELWDTVYALPRKYREVVLMYYLNDFSYKEIARILKIPVGTVMTHLARGRAKLREDLTSYAVAQGFLRSAVREPATDTLVARGALQGGAA